MSDSFGDCLICGDPIKRKILLPCNHCNFCLKCYETMVMCYNEKKCPFCQREVESDPIVSTSKELGSYEDEIKKRRPHDEFYHVYYDSKEDIQEVSGFRKIVCCDCHTVCPNFQTLKGHTRKLHKKEPCEICFDSKCFLPCDTPLYDRQQLKEHMKQHPKCPCCKHIAFDGNTLKKHLQENHFKCDICESLGKDMWFETIELIQVHFHTDHYACENPYCVEQGFIVFATKRELIQHQIEVHKALKSLLKKCKEEIPQEELDETFAVRHMRTINRLKQSLKTYYPNDKNKANAIEKLISDLDKTVLTPDDFCDKYKTISGENASKLFVDVVAAISNPDTRALVVKNLDGIRTCSVRN